MVEEKSKSFQILEVLYKMRFDPGMLYFRKKNKDDDKNEFAKKLYKLGYILYESKINEKSDRIEGFYAAIKTSGIEYFEKLKESKTKFLQNWVIILFTAIIACMTIINTVLTGINIWLSFKN